jgi:hypothetical protein
LWNAYYAAGIICGANQDTPVDGNFCNGHSLIRVYIKRLFPQAEVISVYSRLAITIPLEMSHPTKSDWEKSLQARELKRSEWEPHKQEIKSLYLANGSSLQDIRKLMYQRHGFYATYV